MKKLILALFVAIMTMSCSGSGTNTNTPVSAQDQQAMTEYIEGVADMLVGNNYGMYSIDDLEYDGKDIIYTYNYKPSGLSKSKCQANKEVIYGILDAMAPAYTETEKDLMKRCHPGMIYRYFFKDGVVEIKITPAEVAKHIGY